MSASIPWAHTSDHPPSTHTVFPGPKLNSRHSSTRPALPTHSAVGPPLFALQMSHLSMLWVLRQGGSARPCFLKDSAISPHISYTAGQQSSSHNRVMSQSNSSAMKRASCFTLLHHSARHQLHFWPNATTCSRSSHAMQRVVCTSQQTKRQLAAPLDCQDCTKLCCTELIIPYA